ncbi:hypothetical protein CANARDRAFT_28428 [[Candida] arabinofermentans NRRL YB-2248]|uniref:Nucleoporin NUP188 n=1 Tax=[Candida] arabinofermentans NRRL YB-2248 TaxID=983967 RepID=A0A1E4T060_9ASCO|nr:hypothetical protein CANARDRAFT_28428 [[Candida] arabinofermentans NRRL YB-2248]
MVPKLINAKTEPFKAEADWTLEHAFLILKDPREENFDIKLLEQFLIQIKPLLLSESIPLSKSDSSAKAIVKFELRSIAYKDTLSKKLKDYAVEISDLLNLDLEEVARIMITTSNRIPDEQLLKQDDVNGDRYEDSERNNMLNLFASIALKERRIILKIISQLILTSHKFTSTIIDNITQEIKLKSFKLIEAYIDHILIITNELSNLKDHSLDNLIKYESGLFILEILNLLSQLLLKTGCGFTKSTVVKWFKLMEKTSFLSTLETNLLTTNDEQITTIECLCTAISLILLDLDFNFGSLTNDSTFMNDPEDLITITDCLFNTGSNSIVLYAWSIILHRKFIVITEDPQNEKSLKIAEKFGGLNKLQSTYVACAKDADKLDVCAALLKCQRLLSFDSTYDVILGSFVIAFVPYIQLNDKISLSIQSILNGASDHVVQRFFSNQGTEDLLALCRAKLPISLLLFLRLISLNTSVAIEELTNVRSYMEIFKEEDFYFKYIIDDENPDLVKLTQDVDIIPPYEANGELSLLMKAGTKAQIFSSGSKGENMIVAFLYDYNGWSLLGRILKNISKKIDSDKEKRDLVIEILKLMSKVIDESDEGTIETILGAMSTFIEETSIVDIVFRVLDRAQYSRDVLLLQHSITLLKVLTDNGYSYRVWSYMFTSQLLGSKANGGLANDILGAVEMVDSEFDFTLSLLGLFESLIDDSLTLNNVTSKLKSQVLEKLGSHTIQIFESFIHWRYSKPYQKFQIGTYAVDIFQRTLSYVYSVDEESSPESKVTQVFAAFSNKIATTFLVPDIQSHSARPIVTAIDELSVSPVTLVSNDLFGFWRDKWNHSVLEFSRCLISVRSQFQGTVPSTFEMNLYSKLPNLVDIYSVDLSLRCDIIKLLSALVSAKWSCEPPSFLTHLRQKHAYILLRCLCSDMSNNFEGYKMKVALYDFFSAVMEGNQEGLSIVFITGRDIKEWLLDEKKSSDKKDEKAQYSLLKVLKNNVSMIQHYPDNVALHLVDALSLAYNSWTTVKEEGDDEEFIDMLIQHLSTFPELIKSTDDDAKIIDYCYEVRLLSKIAEILSLYLFVSQNDKCKQKIFQLLKSRNFISNLKYKFKVSGYDHFVLENANKSFESNWPSFRLEQFRNSSIYRGNRYGVESIYSFRLMSSMFGPKENWAELYHDISKASINSQFASAQLITAKSFGALITCFCKTNGSKLDPDYLKLASSLLKINNQEGIPTSLFKSIYQERIELAFIICLSFSSGNDHKIDDKDLFSLISSTCQLLISREIDLDSGLVSLDQVYYKSLLRILLISFKLIKKDSSLLLEYTATFDDIFSDVISRSIKTLLGSIQHEAISHPNKDFGNSPLIAKQIEDIELIASILKTFLHLRLPADLENSIASSMEKNGAFRSILGLYACAHLLKVNQQEVFAEYSLMIINELITVKIFAQKLIYCGLFSTLIDSTISLRIQKGNVSPISPSRTKLHQLWINELLPIIITLIATFGEKILPEVCMFAAAYQRQFQYAINGWLDTNITISTPVIQETSQIILLAKTLNALDAYDYIKNVTPNLEKIVLVPGLDTKEERFNFVTGLNYLISHPKFLSLRIVPVDAEQQRLLESDEKSKFLDFLLDEIRELKESILE